jgi:hypothetical protein
MPGDDEYMRKYADEEAELDRLLARTRARSLADDDDDGELARLRAAIADEKRLRARQENGLELVQASYDKWALMHKFIYKRPFRLKRQQKRSSQWREVAGRFAPIGDGELDEWIGEQIEVAAAREQGRPDMRIRRDGPCFLIVLEYVANKKRSAMAVLHWERAQAGLS